MYHYAANNPIKYTDPDGRETYDSSITKEQFDNISRRPFASGFNESLNNEPSVAGKTWAEAQEFFKEHPNGVIYRNPDEWSYRFYTNEGKDRPVEYNMVTGDELLLIGLGKSLFSIGKGLFKHAGKKALGEASKHGAQRIAGNAATRGGVLTAREIIKTRLFRQHVYKAANGTIVSVFKNKNGTYNLVVDGAKGLVTTFKGISQKAFLRLSKNYGFVLIK